ncbi:MAG: multifunctional CCA tRNA nucleotidyl transferase/2'3'-cyclic phosphodiesterase/2'nucleotidase/phosphatase, partial [Gammaproteobacteria bacterium]|nr:multifunctional CCA tRNA nucleotidyl transferase/2'3'-cyclic phosphodiesterase/2'nucleotidase/phosphatase [Gammaproteobacteria bacterium]
CHRALELRPSTLLRLLESADAFRRPERFERLLLACEADFRGRPGWEDRPYPQADALRTARSAAAAVAAQPLAQQGLAGPDLAQALRELRVAAIRAARPA